MARLRRSARKCVTRVASLCALAGERRACDRPQTRRRSARLLGSSLRLRRSDDPGSVLPDLWAVRNPREDAPGERLVARLLADADRFFLAAGNRRDRIYL